MQHDVKRVRHEIKQRRLRVRSVSRITPKMIRIVFEGDGLDSFVSMAPDDHVKLFFPSDGGGTERRDYTPRHFDSTEHTLSIDFAVHDAGPATRWAVSAAPGDELIMAGPRGSMIIPPSYDWWLLVGDESALPAIGRRIEETAGGIKVISLAAITGPEEEQSFETKADLQALWVHRPAERADDPTPLITALKTLELPQGDGFVWIAAEAHVARAARDYMAGVRQHPATAMKAAGYWIKGLADAHEKFEN